MRFTSDEAKDIRCPLRVDGLYCIGKACAAFRLIPDDPRETPFPQRSGYCGMAGKLEDYEMAFG